MRLLKPLSLALSGIILTGAAMSSSLPVRAEQQSPARAGEKTIFGSQAPGLDIDFPGGNAADYIAAIRKADAEANIVVLGDLARIPVPAMRLRNIDVASALRILDALPQQQDTQVVNVNIKEIVHGGDRSPVYTITAWLKSQSKAKPAELQTTVISMADLLGENLTQDDALKAIATALELIKNEYELAQIRFHAETGLLIARGAPEQVANVMEVIRQLRERAGTLQMRKENAENAQRAAQTRNEIEVLRRQAGDMHMRNDFLEAELNRLRATLSDLEQEARSLRAERDTLARQVAEIKPKPGGSQQ